MRDRPDEDDCTRQGLYNPYPPWKTARSALLAAALLVGMLVTHGRFVVEGGSMLPGVRPGDRLLVRRWPRRVRRGAVVVVADPREPRRLVCKRVGEVRGRTITVLGDNAAASTDSRTYGPVPVTAVWGRVIYRYAPAGRAGRVR